MTGNPENIGSAQNAGFAPEVPRTRLSTPARAAAAIRGGAAEARSFVYKSHRWGVKISLRAWHICRNTEVSYERCFERKFDDPAA
jgi:hypothetical protein